MLVIFGSSLTLTFQDVNMKTGSTGQNVLTYLDYVFTLFFIVEMFLKWFGFGLKKYFTDPWSILDFLIVIVSLSYFFATLRLSEKLIIFNINLKDFNGKFCIQFGK